MIDELISQGTQARALAPPPGSDSYQKYCAELATRLTGHWDQVLAASAADVAVAKDQGLPDALIDRLTLSARHLTQLVDLAGDVARALPAATEAGPPQKTPGTATSRRIPKPLGLILMIYEARPTVTVEGALLPVAVGNAVILRGGSETGHASRALGAIVTQALLAAGLPAGLVQVVTDPDRRLIRELLKRADAIDALIPRGSPALIDYCQRASTIPVIASGGGSNHLYIDRTADPALAAAITLDSKLAEPTACNTLEMVLAHADLAQAFLTELTGLAARTGQPCQLRLDGDLYATAEQATGVTIVPLQPHDYGREFLDRTVGIRRVTGPGEAIAHIRQFGSKHTEGILASDPAVIQRFLTEVDAAALVVNSSLRLHDGPSMGLGPELSISTGRLHVRGPVGLAALQTYSWVIEGAGSLRGSREEAAP